MKNILVTGGAGYIGSHACVELLNAGYNVVVIDNLSNSKVTSLERVQDITNKELAFIETDLLDKENLYRILSGCSFNAVIHFAGLKSVSESVESPLKYYQNNVCGSLNLFEVMEELGVFNLVYSSSATVYGNPKRLPISENSPLSVTNPYGNTKLVTEEVLRDLGKSDKRWNVSILRYFNPIGAHESGKIGENPNGIPANLVPYVSQVATGKLDKLSVFGGDYPTRDGTGIRDYVHVTDLAIGHVKALEKLSKGSAIEVYNLGTGQGYSVLEVIEAFELISNRKIPYQIEDRRPGDIAECFADVSRAEDALGWKAMYGLKEMIEHAWNWQQQNPNGY